MKIVVVGSHGVGKTTVAMHIVQYLNKQTIVHLHNQLTEELKHRRDPMKIGVTGSHGTGKTTLSMLLTGRHKQFKFLEESPRQAVKAGFSFNEDTSLATELWIFAKQAEMEMNGGPDFVADKCFVDLLAYAEHLLPQETALLEVLTNLALKHFKNYDLVVYLPTGEFPLIDDGWRSMDQDFYWAIDRKILEIMKRYGIKYHRITGSEEERHDKVIALLS